MSERAQRLSIADSKANQQKASIATASAGTYVVSAPVSTLNVFTSSAINTTGAWIALDIATGVDVASASAIKIDDDYVFNGKSMDDLEAALSAGGDGRVHIVLWMNAADSSRYSGSGRTLVFSLDGTSETATIVIKVDDTSEGGSTNPGEPETPGDDPEDPTVSTPSALAIEVSIVSPSAVKVETQSGFSYTFHNEYKNDKNDENSTPTTTLSEANQGMASISCATGEGIAVYTVTVAGTLNVFTSSSIEVSPRTGSWIALDIATNVDVASASAIQMISKVTNESGDSFKQVFASDNYESMEDLEHALSIKDDGKVHIVLWIRAENEQYIAGREMKFKLSDSGEVVTIKIKVDNSSQNSDD